MRYVVVVLALAQAATSCGASRENDRFVASGERVELTGARGGTAPAGSTFTIALKTPLASDRSAVGDVVAAVATVPLNAADGAVVVPEGAVLRGRVSRLGARTTPALAVEFESIETVDGVEPVALKLTGARQVTLAGTKERYDPDQAYDGIDLLFHTRPPSTIRVPEGEILSVTLVEPIVAAPPSAR